MAATDTGFFEICKTTTTDGPQLSALAVLASCKLCACCGNQEYSTVLV